MESEGGEGDAGAGGERGRVTPTSGWCQPEVGVTGEKVIFVSKYKYMTSQSAISSAVGQLIHQAEQLHPGEFDLFVLNILALNARRKSEGLPQEESVLLKKINKEFSQKKMERFLLLDEKRQQEALTAEEHRELLSLVRQLEKYDAQKLHLAGQLALLRKVSLDAILKQLGLYQTLHV